MGTENMPDPASLCKITVGAGVNRAQAMCQEVSGEKRVPAIAKALREIQSRNEAWWSPHNFKNDYRKIDNWQSSIGIGVDCDHYPDGNHGKKEDHKPVPADLAEKIAQYAKDGVIPGNLFHNTPRGFRVVFVFDEPCEDITVVEQAALGACALVDRAVAALGLFAFEVDVAATRDMARLLFTPTSIVGGVTRNNPVSVMRGQQFKPADLAGEAPVVPEPALIEQIERSLNKESNVTRIPTKFAATIDEATRLFNVDHIRELPKNGSACPICESPDGFKQLPGADGRWTCFSSRHQKGGLKGKGNWHGDSLDIEAYKAGETPVEHLRSRGYLPKTVARAPDAHYDPFAFEEVDPGEPPAWVEEADAMSMAWDPASVGAPVHLTPRPVPPVKPPPSGPSGGGSTPPPPKKLPRIELSPFQIKHIDEGVDALAALPNVFQRAGRLVRINESPWIKHHPYTSAIVGDIPSQSIGNMLTEAADILGFDRKTSAWVQSHPPAWLYLGIYSLGTWRNVRPLRALFNGPFVRPDGSVRLEQGFDDDTQSWLNETCARPLIMTGGQALAAQCAQSLLKVVDQFPWATPAHASAWLAALLTPLGRAAFEGPSPMFAFDANTRGSGKSRLVDIISIIVNGKVLPRRALDQEETEQRKLITTIVKAASTMVMLDNVKHEVGGAAIEAALTGDDWEDRALGSNDSISGPLGQTWYVTGNNIKFTSDTIRRVMWIRLESKLENPEDRDDMREKKILAYVERERVRLLSDALTILSSYIKLGKPSTTNAIGSFEGWCELVRNAIIWCGLEDPASTRAVLAAKSDTAKNALDAVIASLYRIPDMDQNGDGMSASDIALYAKDERMGELGRDLAEALALSIGGSDTAPITPMRIAKMMAKNVGKVVDGMRIAIRRDRKRKMDRYVVEVVDAQASDSGPGAPPGPV